MAIYLLYIILLSSIILLPMWLFGNFHYITHIARAGLLWIIMNEMPNDEEYWRYYAFIIWLISSIAFSFAYSYIFKKKTAQTE